MKHKITFFLILPFVGLLFACGNGEENSEPTTVQQAPDPAIVKLSEEIHKEPNNPELYAQRGELYYQLQNYDQAIADLSKAIELDSLQPQYYHLLADAYLDYYRSRQALYTMQLAASKFPQRIPTLLKLAEFQWILKQYNDALFTLERIRIIDPQNAEMFFMFGNVFRDMGKTEQAINAYQSCVENDPENIDAWIELAKLVAQTNPAAADRYYDNALRVDSNNVAALHAKAYYLSNIRNDLQGALALYKRINVIDPQYVDGYYNAGLLYLDMDSVEQALKQFDIAVQMAPTFTDAYYHRGVAYELLGKTANAISDYETVLRLDPEYQGAKAGIARLKQTQ